MDKIIDKIRKLLALAANNPSEGERDAAMRKAHQLLVDHNLQMQDVQVTSETINVYVHNMNSRATPWARTITDAIAKLYFCKFVYSVNNKKLRANFVGMRVDAEIARMVAENILDSVRRESVIYGATTGGSPGSFRNGAAATVYHRAMQMMRDAAPDKAPGTALVVQSLYKQRAAEAEAFAANYWRGLKKPKSKLNVRHDEAGRAGAAFAQTVSLTANIKK